MNVEQRGRRRALPRIALYSAWAALLALAGPAIGAPAAYAQSGPTIEDRGVEVEFPERLTFRAHVDSRADIERIILEYGVDKLTCGTVTAKAFPEFEPGRSADVSWSWEMLQSGSEPPGAEIWYRWRAIDTEGGEAVTETRRLVWLDDVHDWQSISRDQLTFHWYGVPRSFAEELLDAAVDSLDDLERTASVAVESPIDLYIYSDTADMREAVLYEPGWTGGLAYPGHDIVIIGISPDLIEWGKDTEAHELTHVLVGHLTFSCLGDVPTWLNEGVAVYGEGGLDAASQDRLQQAIADDALLSVRSLSGSFSEVADKADLSYSQSYSVVNFLTETYGPDKVQALFRDLRDGMTIEDALDDVYGFGLDALEDAWRASIGAQPRRAEGATPTATPIPTPVPTYRPISAVAAATAAATVAPTRRQVAAVPPTAGPADTPPASAAADPSPAGIFAIVAVAAAVVGVMAVAFALRRRRTP